MRGRKTGIFLYKRLGMEPSSLYTALSYFSQVLGEFRSLLEAGPGGTCIVHIIAGILCFLDIGQQEIPGTNLSTQFYFFLIFIFREKEKDRQTQRQLNEV